jgi:hypothetical protein
MPTPQEIFDKKDKFLENREDVLDRKVIAAQKKLLDVIVDEFLDQLETSGGVIQNNGKNISATQAIEKIFADFDKTLNKDLVDGYIKDIQAGQALNTQYFSTFEEDPKQFATTSNRVQTTVRNRLGITKDNTIKRNGYLGNFLRNNPGRQEVLEIATKAITGEQSKAEARKQLATSVTGDGTVSGSLAGHYRTFINDTYQQIDNLESKEYATALGMKAAYYLGGTINTTRKFCRQRNGNLYTDEEIASWENLKWQGKNKNYDPFTDMGGYNCRHRFRYISNKQAARNRPDLELTEDGKLVKKAGASIRGPLNKIEPPKKEAPKKRSAPKVKPPSTSNLQKGLDNEKEWLNKLSKDEVKSINTYTGNKGFDMNEKLRTGSFAKHVSAEEALLLDKNIIDLQKILATGPKYTGPTFRGLTFRDAGERQAFDNKIVKGGIFKDKAFGSTTHDEEVLRRFQKGGDQGVRMNIQGKNGVIIENASKIKSEGEVLYNRGTTYIVKDKRYDSEGTLIIDLIEQ